MRAAALLIVVALAGGCADTDTDEANDYVAKVNAAQADFADAGERLRSRLDASVPTPRGIASLEDFSAEVDGLVDRLGAIEPPERVEALHDRLIAAMTRFGAGLRRAGSELASDNAGAILDGQQRLAAESRRVTTTVNATIGEINAALTG